MGTYKLSIDEKAEYNALIMRMMMAIHQICVDNGIKYTLIGGSMLGAIRHHGFIPWDDDLDIALPRPDYEKLRRILIDNPIEGCFWQDYSTEPHYNQPYAKLRMDGTKYVENFTKNLQIHQGIFIDIFPLDKVKSPESASAKYRQKLVRMLTFAVWSKEKCFMKRKGIKKLEHVVSGAIGMLPQKKMLVDFQNRLVNRENKDWRYRASMYSSNYKPNKIYFDTNDFNSLELVPFEDTELYVVSTYAEFLTRLFKNYMEYPPVEKRNSGHDVCEIKT